MNRLERANLVFWLDCPSPHQAGYVRHLSEMHDVTVVCSGNVQSERISLGWESGNFGKARLIFTPGESEIVKLVYTHPSSSVHVFSAIHRYPISRKAYWKVAQTQALVGLLAEGRDWRGLKGILRRIESFVYERRIGDRLDFVLAIGHLSWLWHRMCGISEEKIFPFAYFLGTYSISPFMDETISNLNQGTDSDPEFRLIFVGNLIARKRVSLLLQALAMLRSLPWRLTIVGDGPQRSSLEKKAGDLGIAERISFTGILKNTHVSRVMSKADLLVLPSAWDGWGAVVNEALEMGLPVVCSDFCGAQVLLEGERGETFPVDSVQGMAEVLRRRIEAGRLSVETRNRIRSWSSHISGQTGANYLNAIFKHLISKRQAPASPRPLAPWINT